MLERRRGIGEPEWHHKELKVALMRPECRLLNVCSMHTDLMTPRPKVQLSKKSGALQFIQ